MDSEHSPMCTNKDIPAHMIPTIGLNFKSKEEAYAFYNEFAARRGFSIRKQGGKKDKDSGVYLYYRFVCSKEGIERSKKILGSQGKTITQKTRNSAIRRTGCYARLSIAHRDEEQWQVTHFEDQHNHQFASTLQSHFLRSQRKVPIEKQRLLSHYTKLNIRPSIQYRILVSQYGNNTANVGCLAKDLENCRRTQRKMLDGHDADMFVIYLEGKKKKDPDFHYTIDTDETNKFRGCFWADAKAQRAYNYFGDCVVMDATYKTNKYNMIFATIAGVNHHRQTIVFGCALLADEKLETYKWMLRTWLQAMPTTKVPSVIITDQDPALRNAICEELPNTFHRYCIWHILQKFDKKLTPSEMTDYYPAFKESIKHSDSICDFEHLWQKALDESGLHNHVWLKEIYNIRMNWVPAFCKQYFSAGMSSSQRVESSHSFFKKYLSDKNTLLDFITKFDMALQFQRENELRSDYDEINQEVRLKTLFPIEQEMRKIYTHKNFHRFQNEVYHTQTYLALLTKGESVELAVYGLSTGEEKTETAMITWEKKTNIAICSCKMWDFEGIPCRHIIFFYRAKGQSTLPAKYTLNRWTKSATSKMICINKNDINDNPNKDLIMRHMHVSRLCQILAEKACLREESTQETLTQLELLINKIQGLNLENGVAETQVLPSITIPDGGSIKDPDYTKTKGSGIGGRYKRKREILASKQTRRCQECLTTGHNRRTCPNLNKSKGPKEHSYKKAQVSDSEYETHSE